MGWIPVYHTMPKHTKTLKLADALNISRREAMGLLVDLWIWGMDSADKDGLIQVTPQGLADVLDWPRRRAKILVQALVDAGYLDPDRDVYRLHDWVDYMAPLIDRRQKDAARKRAERSKKIVGEQKTEDETCDSPQDVTRTVRRMSRGQSTGRHADSPQDVARIVPVTSGCYRNLNRNQKDDKKNNTNRVQARARDGGEQETDAVEEHPSASQAPENPANVPEELDIMQLFANEMGAPPTSRQKRGLEEWCAQIGADLVALAIAETRDHGAQNMGYLESILRDWQGAGITTVEEAEQRKTAFRQAKQAKPDVMPGKVAVGGGKRGKPWNDFNQRQYSDDDFKHLYANLDSY